MNKQDIYNLLKNENVPHEITEHAAVYTIEAVLRLGLAGVERVAKNLFLRDDKKNYYLAVIHEDKKVNLKELQSKINSRRLSFANEARLKEILDLYSGAVTPFGVLNDKERKVTLVIEQSYIHSEIGVHPLDNTATVFMQVDDLLNIIAPFCKEIITVKL